MHDFRIVCDGIDDKGYFLDKYGKFGVVVDGIPVVNPPIRFVGFPEGTVSFALVLEDKDAFRVSGFSWVHWVCCNIKKDIEEDIARYDPPFVQGCTTLMSKNGGLTREESTVYGGMAPPDRDHLYEIHAYALDTDLDLTDGFFMPDLYHEMEGHVLATHTVKGWYRA